ncbi:hypothetical protein MRX96_037755 [Rhipicephalus microplus]
MPLVATCSDPAYLYPKVERPSSTYPASRPRTARGRRRRIPLRKPASWRSPNQRQGSSRAHGIRCNAVLPGWVDAPTKQGGDDAVKAQDAGTHANQEAR